MKSFGVNAKQNTSIPIESIKFSKMLELRKGMFFP